MSFRVHHPCRERGRGSSSELLGNYGGVAGITSESITGWGRRLSAKRRKQAANRSIFPNSSFIRIKRRPV